MNHGKQTPKPPTLGGTILTIRPKDPKTVLDPFAVGDTIKPYTSKNTVATTDNTGTYYIRVHTDEAVRKLTKTTKLKDGTPTLIQKQIRLNTVKCIIQHPTITKMTDETLGQRLKSQGVTKVRGIGPNGRLKVLHISGTRIPQHIMLGPIQVRTETYYPMPRVCRKCKAIGHITETCTARVTRCGTCSEEHDTTTCTKSPQCINCGDGHTPLDKVCPVYKQEKAIIKIATDQSTSLGNARRIYRNKTKHTYIALLEEKLEATSNTDVDTDDDLEKPTDTTTEQPDSDVELVGTDNMPKPMMVKGAKTEATTEDTKSPSTDQENNKKAAKRKAKHRDSKRKTPKRASKDPPETTEEDLDELQEAALVRLMAKQLEDNSESD